ncbi:MAG: DUF5710 domain-containing protein [Methylotenera sp.]|uniref:DUF5710 domain-containing protein n=1 Tax=Methylotenera sp. TaxID=2051956 RepID=UPI002488681C|nr:DUF5710 domain-containing protein [Methylotenera sp.]MDI1309498.1 DUF5710 domain-containing protein [Methylotenera sp.]
MTATSNIALKVPFNEKDQAKSLGARWNAESKHWYVPQGVDAAPFEKWFTNSPTQVSSPSVAKPTNTNKPTSNQSFDDDIDAINAKLRDAYETNEAEPF